MLMMFESARCVYKTDSLEKEEILMEILQPILTRRSIRKYRDTPVEDDKIQAMLVSARLAPSGNNSQPWNFIIAKSEATRKKIAEACYNQTWMTQAPVFIVCVADIRTRIKGQVAFEVDDQSPEPALKKIIRDTAIAVEHLVLQAEALGLATCWVGYFDQQDIRPLLNIPSDLYVLAVIPVGYADEHPSARPRKALEDIVYYETWGNKNLNF